MPYYMHCSFIQLTYSSRHKQWAPKRLLKMFQCVIAALCVHTPSAQQCLCSHSLSPAVFVFTLPQPSSVCVHTPSAQQCLCSHSLSPAVFVFTLPQPSSVCVHTPSPQQCLCSHSLSPAVFVFTLPQPSSVSVMPVYWSSLTEP